MTKIGQKMESRQLVRNRGGVLEGEQRGACRGWGWRWLQLVQSLAFIIGAGGPILMDPGGLIWSMVSEEDATDIRPHLLDLDEFL